MTKLLDQGMPDEHEFVDVRGHRFSPSGFVTSCADGCCREETCAVCGEHEDANFDHEDHERGLRALLDWQAQ